MGGVGGAGTYRTQSSVALIFVCKCRLSMLNNVIKSKSQAMRGQHNNDFDFLRHTLREMR